jgi:hypothetical protein
MKQITYLAVVKTRSIKRVQPVLELVDNIPLHRFCRAMKVATEIKEASHLYNIPVFLNIDGIKKATIIK